MVAAPRRVQAAALSDLSEATLANEQTEKEDSLRPHRHAALRLQRETVGGGARLLGDSAYGSAEMLGWLVYDHGIEPHVTVFGKSTRQDGTFSRNDFAYDHVGDVYSRPAGKMLTTTGSRVDGATYATARASMTAKPAA